jgi:hypothetical protein
MMGHLPATHIDRDITATRDEFLHALRLAFPGGVVETEGAVRVAAQGTMMEIAIDPGPDRRTAALWLPTVRVRIRFVTGSEAERQAMLAQMDRAMLRGGG